MKQDANQQTIPIPYPKTQFARNLFQGRQLREYKYLHGHKADELGRVVEDMVRARDEPARVQREHTPRKPFPFFESRYIRESVRKDNRV